MERKKLKVSEFTTEREISGHFSSLSFIQKITPVTEHRSSPSTPAFI
jgi:hypothetical protein